MKWKNIDVGAPTGNAFVPYRYGDNMRSDLYGWCRLWFDNRSVTNTICIVAAVDDSTWGGCCWSSYNLECVYVESIRDAAGSQHAAECVAACVVHETGHQFALTAVDTNHLQFVYQPPCGDPWNRDLWCHLGPDTETCVMGYDCNQRSGIVEFCACPSQQSMDHHAKDVREAADPLP